MPLAHVTIRVRVRGVGLARAWVRLCGAGARFLGEERAQRWALAGAVRLVRVTWSGPV